MSNAFLFYAQVCALTVLPHALWSQDMLKHNRSTPFMGLGGAFSLSDHNGEIRTQIDPRGRAQLLFFGYASCLQICSAVLPQMGRLTHELEQSGFELQPLMITVDSKRDTNDVLSKELTKFHPRFLGLNGTQGSLKKAYKNFQIQHEVVFEDPEYGPIYAHGNFIYLLDAKGHVLTLIPPVLSDEKILEIIHSYLS